MNEKTKPNTPAAKPAAPRAFALGLALLALGAWAEVVPCAKS